MASAPIVLVPGFWLGAWAWDEVADALRADGHEVTALTLPGLESADADRSDGHVRRSRRRDLRCRRGRRASRRARRSQRSRIPGLRRERSRPRADRGDGLRRHRPGEGAMDADFDGDETRCPRSTSSGRTRISTASATSSSRLSGVERCRSPAASSARAWSSRTTRGSTFRAPRSARVTPQSSTGTQ